MATSLVIVDSDQKARTLAAQMPGEVQTVLLTSPPVKATLLPPKDPLTRESPHFSFAPVAEARGFWETLQNAQAMDIYVAFDSDQRGEYWAWLINGYLLASTNGVKSIRRLHLLGLSREELQESFRLVDTVQNEKAVAYYVRFLFNSHFLNHLKRLLGTATGPQGLPLASGALATLFLLSERESEIRTFTPAVRWQVRARFAGDGDEFDARLEEAYGISDDGYLRDSAQCREAINLFRDKPFQIGELEREEIVIQPPAPFRLVELLEEAYVVHQLQPRQVLDAMVRLYQGVEVQGASVGLVSNFLPLEQVDMRTLFAKLRGEAERMFGPTEVTAENVHEELRGAVVPLRPELNPAELAGALSPAEQQVYALIHARALASQMRPATGELIEAVVSGGQNCLFRTSGRSLVNKGFLAAYAGHQYRELLAVSPLAKLEAGQQLRSTQIIPEQTSGFPPEYYTFEGLATDLADFAIAMDVSAITMLQSMLDRGYVALMPDGTWRCQDNTNKLVNVMNKAFPSMRGINLSAYFEQTLNEVVSGRKPLGFALQQFDQTLMMQGNVLVKVKMPVVSRSRVKTSRSIIKTPTAESLRPGEAATVMMPPAGEQAPAEAEEVAASPVEETAVEAAVAEPSVESVTPAEGVSEVAAESEEAAVPVSEQGEVLAPSVEAVPPEEAMSAETSMEEAAATSAEEEAASQEVFASAAAEPMETPQEEASPVAATVAAGPAKPCPDCGRPLLLKEDRFGKYWFCSGHPECRHSESYGKEVGLSMGCPLCQIGKVVIKQTPTGKPFYVCPEQDCEFMAWSQPHAFACQVCDSPFLVEKKNLAGKSYLRCPRAGCNYMQPLPGDDASAGELLAGGQPGKKKVLVRRVKGSAAGGGGRKVRVVRRKK